MAEDWLHGSRTKLSIDGEDISGWTNTSELGRSGETHNVTMYGSPEYPDGRKANEYTGGNVDASFKCGGVYDRTATTGTAMLRGLEAQKVELVRQPEGIGTGKPTQTVDIIVTSYVETAPIADMVTWQLEAQCSGLIAETAQA